MFYFSMFKLSRFNILLFFVLMFWYYDVFCFGGLYCLFFCSFFFVFYIIVFYVVYSNFPCSNVPCSNVLVFHIPVFLFSNVLCCSVPGVRRNFSNNFTVALFFVLFCLFLVPDEPRESFFLWCRGNFLGKGFCVKW